MDISGFYYDRERKRYFRLESGLNRHNPLTTTRVSRNNALKAVRHYQHNQRLASLPKSISDHQISKQSMYNLREDVFRSQFKGVVSRVVSDLRVVDYKSCEHLSADCEQLIASPTTDQLFAVTSVDCGGGHCYTVYCISVEDVFSQVYDINASKRLLSSYPPFNRVVDISLANDSQSLATLSHHFNEHTIRSSFSISQLSDVNQINADRLVYEYPELLFSAANCGDINVLGVENGIKMFKPSYSRAHRLFPIEGNVTTLKFINKSGNSFISTTNKGTFHRFDIRQNNELSHILRVKISDTSIVYAAVLSDENSVITSGHNNHLSLTDLRMTDKPVLSYANHSNACKKIAFSVDENSDILCSTGDDNVIRLWSLRNAKMLYMIAPDVYLSGQNETCQSLSNVCYSHSWKCLRNESKPLICCFTANRFHVLTTNSHNN